MKSLLHSFNIMLIISLLVLSFSCAGSTDDEEKDEDDTQIENNINATDNCEINSSLSDPYFNYQWHLDNTDDTDMDINVTSVWESGVYGCGIIVAVVDDGIQIDHEDLSDNMVNVLNYNYINPSSTNVSGSGDCDTGNSCHGTSVAGVIAARAHNEIGLRGAAGVARLAGLNMLYYFTDQNQYDAMSRNAEFIHISNNSWGPEDTVGRFTPSAALWQAGILDGLNKGRNGKGTIYVWAAGNGANSYFDDGHIDNSNYDGYANYYAVISIAAITNNGRRAFYSEKGANVWVSTYSSGGTQEIATTDVTGSSGYNPDYEYNLTSDNKYYTGFGGTSSAAPLAAGIIALMLERNNNLSWRDVKMILAETAVANDTDDSDWTTNGAGYNINHKYGFGSIDATAAVSRASSWSNIGAEIVKSQDSNTLNESIPDNNSAGLSNTVTVSSSGIGFIEYVAISVNIKHSSAGQLEISLVSPAGTESILSEKHSCYEDGFESKCTYFDTTAGNIFTFGSARHLGESANGDWKITVKDLENGETGQLNSWLLKFYGRSSE